MGSIIDVALCSRRMYCPEVEPDFTWGAHWQHGSKSYHAQITKDDLQVMDMEDDIENFSS